MQAKGKALIQRLRLMREKSVGTVQACPDKILEHPDLRQLRQVTKPRWKGLLVIKTWMTILGTEEEKWSSHEAGSIGLKRLEKRGICPCYGECWRLRSLENGGL